MLTIRYPYRPHNHAQTPPFHDLFQSLFNPLNENQKRPTGPTVARAKQGPHGPSRPSPHEIRRQIIERFISRWRANVGDDFYPALRLILPEKDRDRPMYGLKEKAIARLIIKLLNLHQDSDDGFNLLNFKLPARGPSSFKAGDFAGRCYDVLTKRPMLQQPGTMRIAEVNELLDKLSSASKDDVQLPIFQEFYQRMNADELMWLIRIMLRAMKVGATEKTILTVCCPSLLRESWTYTNSCGILMLKISSMFLRVSEGSAGSSQTHRSALKVMSVVLQSCLAFSPS